MTQHVLDDLETYVVPVLLKGSRNEPNSGAGQTYDEEDMRIESVQVQTYSCCLSHLHYSPVRKALADIGSIMNKQHRVDIVF